MGNDVDDEMNSSVLYLFSFFFLVFGVSVFLY